MKDKIDWAIGFVIGASIVTTLFILFLEYAGILNFVTFTFPYDLPDILPGVNAYVTGILTLILALLYFRQSTILERQTELQKFGHQPNVVVDVDVNDDHIPVFIIRNVGETAAIDVDTEWKFETLSRSISLSVLTPGDKYEFPVAKVDNELHEEPLDAWQITEGHDEEEFLDYELSYFDPNTHENHTEEGKIPVLTKISYRGGVVGYQEY